MKQIGLLLFAFAFSITLFGQSKILSNSERLIQIKEYLLEKDLHVPHYIFDSIIETYQKGLSGNSVKDGKLAASSLTITEKGASIQIGFPGIEIDDKKTLYIGANLSGSGTDKFISVSKDGKYQNTLSGGVVFNFFPGWGSAKFKASDHWQTRTIAEQYLRQYETIEKNDPFEVTKERAYINKALGTLRQFETLVQTKFGNKDGTGRQDQKKFDADTITKSEANLIQRARIARDTLIALGILSKKYLEMEDVSKRIAAIPSDFASADQTLRLKKFIAKADKEFMNARWTSYKLHWITLKTSYNVTPYKMINPAKPDDNYADTHDDAYFSLALSYNLTQRKARRSQFQWSISPTISFSNARDFSSLKQLLAVISILLFT